MRRFFTTSCPLVAAEQTVVVRCWVLQWWVMPGEIATIWLFQIQMSHRRQMCAVRAEWVSANGTDWAYRKWQEKEKTSNNLSKRDVEWHLLNNTHCYSSFRICVIGNSLLREHTYTIERRELKTRLNRNDNNSDPEERNSTRTSETASTPDHWKHAG